MVVAAFLIGLSPVVANAQDEGIVVHGDAAKVEIERILNADNLNTGSLGARFVAETISGITRGRAPLDFWTAYQAHVRAWYGLANAEEQARGMPEDLASAADSAALVVDAERQIAQTFDEVERIAISYGARMPVPPMEVVPTT